MTAANLRSSTREWEHPAAVVTVVCDGRDRCSLDQDRNENGNGNGNGNANANE